MARRYEKTLKILLIILIALNLIDGVLTLYWIKEGIAFETNPLMRAWIQISPDLFILIKMLFVIMGASLLWICRKNRMAYWGGLLCLSIYSGIIFIHMHIALQTLGA